MKRTVLAVLVAGLVAASGGVLYSSDAFGVTVTCSGTPGTLPGATINGNVAVPSGSWCNIQGQTVNGNVNVASGGGLVIGSGSTINGNVNANSPGSFATNPCGTGSGNFSVVLGSSNTVTGSFTVTGAPKDVIVGGNGCGGSTINKNLNINSNPGLVHVEGNTVGKNASVVNNGPTPTPVVAGNTVGGNLSCSPATGSGNTAKHISGTCT